MEILYGNEGVVALTKEPIDHGKSSHIKRKFRYIRDRGENGDLVVK